MIVYSRTIDKHVANLQTVFAMISARQLKLKISKCDNTSGVSVLQRSSRKAGCYGRSIDKFIESCAVIHPATSMTATFY